MGGLCKALFGSFQPVYGLASAASVILIGLSFLLPSTRRDTPVCRSGLANLQ
jgi:hypothetical protein